MAERIVLTAPQKGVVAVPATSVYELVGLDLYRAKVWENGALVEAPDRSYIRAVFVGEHGHTESLSYTGEEAHNDIAALNKANLTTNSLHKRVMSKFIAKFPEELGGTVQGTVD